MSRENPPFFNRLLRLAQAGSREAFGEIYELWAERIFRFCLKRTGDRELAADLTSEIFLKIWQKLPQFKGDHASFDFWAYQIARNTQNDYFRKKQMASIPLDDLPEMAAEIKNPFEAADIIFDRRLEEALSSLSDEFRRAIELRYIKDLTFGQVAKSMRKKEGTVRVILSRALRALREKLK